MNKAAPMKIDNSKDDRPREEGAKQAESGVDRSLIEWMLSLSPEERLEVVQQQVNALHKLKDELHQG